MARMNKIRRELEKERTAEKAKRGAVFEALWRSPRYVKIDELEQRVLREWNRLDAYKNTPSGQPEKLERILRRLKRIARRRQKMEDDALKKAGAYP